MSEQHSARTLPYGSAGSKHCLTQFKDQRSRFAVFGKQKLDAHASIQNVRFSYLLLV